MRRGPITGAAALVLAAACALLYADRLSGPFLFDDQQSVVDNATIRGPGLARALQPERDTPMAGRPLANLSLALDYAWFGLEPVAYHATNLLLHFAVALLGFLLLRELLGSAAFSPRVRARAGALALASALLFVVHPLCVEEVLYTSQRTESLAALAYLGVLLLLARAAANARAARYVLPLAALGLLGAGSKEVFATAPVIALLFDRAFFAGSLRGALRARLPLHATLLACLIPIAWLQRGDPRPGSVRFAEADYLIAQAQIIPHYFAVALWPAHPVLDYGPLLPQSAAAAWPYLLGTGLLVAACALLCVTHPRLGFPGAFIFGVLAPSSSLFSIHTEVGADRRFYLPLLALLACCVLLAEALLAWLQARRAPPAGAAPWLLGGCALLAAGALGARARAHASDFASLRAAWQSAAQARPQNPRAHYNLAKALAAEGDVPGAVAELRAALARDPDYAEAHANLGGLLLAQGRQAEALAHMRRSAELRPGDAQAHYDYGLGLGVAGHFAQAAAELAQCVRLEPQRIAARVRLALALARAGRMPEAQAQASWLRAHAPGHPEVQALQRMLEAAPQP